MILLLSNYSILYSILFFLLRIPLEIISSLKDLLSLRFKHFINHYLAFFWIIFHLGIIKKRRFLINKIRCINDTDILNKKIILNRSIVMNYFLFQNKKYSDLKEFIQK